MLGFESRWDVHAFLKQHSVFFELLDADGDSKVDTLRVVSVRHASARPIWDMDANEEV